jgi:regulator of sigma E protease
VQTALAFIFVLGVLVFVHELGHFLMAKRIGVRVLKFQLGFNPTILSFRRGDTEYGVGLVPLGGYVKMAGENPDDRPTGAADEFLSKPKWQRFQVMIMGPAMNLILAVVVMAVVLYQGAEVPAYEDEPPVIGRVVDSSPAARVGLQPGDRILSVAGRPVETWEQFVMEVLPKANRETEIVVSRAGQELRKTITPEPQSKYEFGYTGVLPQMHPQVRELTPDGAAAAAGLQKGDVILAVNGEPNVTRERLIELIKASEGRPIALLVRRGDGSRTLGITPREDGGVPMIGALLWETQMRTIEPGPVQAVALSLETNWDWTKLIFRTLVGLFTRETSVKQLMGPVAIAELSGESARLGWVALFNLMALISLNLGLLNLLPIPVLDGGHIMIMALEGLARRDFSMRAKEKMLIAGFVVLMALMVTVIYNDLMRVQGIQQLVPWR